MLAWDDMKVVLKQDGYLPELEVLGLTFDDWSSILNCVRENDWAHQYEGEGVVLSEPNAAEIHARCENTFLLLRIWPGADLQIIAKFFGECLVFEIDTREFHGQSQLDVLCTFIRAVGQAVNKDVVLLPEGLDLACEVFILQYDSAQDRFSRGNCST
jgi:hypothetical protein